MNRVLFLPVCLSVAVTAGAQSIALVSPGNVPVPGASFLVHRGDYMAPAAGGANILFNFSAATATSSSTYQWQDPSDLPNGAQFPGAQFALTNAGPDTIFYKETASGLERIGDDQTIAVGTTPYHLVTAYSNSILEMQLPLSYNATPWTDQFTGSFTVTQDGTTGERNGGITGGADAWGRLVLPGGNDTVEVLRVTTRLQETIPLNVGITVNVSHVHNVNAFYPLWGKFPVLRMVSDTLSAMGIVQTGNFTEWLDTSAVGIAEAAAASSDLHLFPNPANGPVEIDFTAHGGSVLQVIDACGQVVLHRELTSSQGRSMERLDVADWAPGLYQVVLTGANGARSVQRLMVVR